MLIRLFIPVLLVAVLVIARSSSRRKSNEEASCPKRCTCDRNNVVCRRNGFTSDVLEQIHNRAFPYLETIVFTGNNFGDISENPFRGEILKSVSLVNFTSNKISKISEETFSSFPNNEYLHLSDNRIQGVGKNPFRGMPRMRSLEMNRALADMPPEQKAELVRSLFESDRDELPELSIVNLNNNFISKLHPDSFCRVSGLLRLLLSGNQLSSLNLTTECMPRLNMLDISNNKFTTIPEALWDNLTELTSLDISGNPLHCDCSLMPFIKIAQGEDLDFINQGKTVCASPPELAGKNIFEIKIDLCQQGGGFGFGTFLILLILVGIGGFAYYRYKNRRRHIPLPDNFSYAGLTNDDDVQPEFV